ncbi:MAG: T9SS type A sorting domain-containing protein [candidate division Zixibacteria bacterium]|nr:T9SS type A sorting domain-containing protein [candidate division Zixibacteria bacterium]
MNKKVLLTIITAIFLITVTIPSGGLVWAAEKEIVVYEKSDDPDAETNHEHNKENLPDGAVGVPAGDLEEAAQGILDQLEEGDCIKDLHFRGHAAPGVQGVGDGVGYDASKHINTGNDPEWKTAFAGLQGKFCDNATIHLWGCNVGSCNDGASKLKEIADFFGVTAKGAVNKVTAGGQNDYDGPIQEANPDEPQPEHMEADAEKAKKKKKSDAKFENIPEQYWYFGGGENLGCFYEGLCFGPEATILENQVYGYNDEGYPPHSGHAVLFSAGVPYIDVTFDMPTNYVGVWYTCGQGDFNLVAYDQDFNVIHTDQGPENYGENGYLEVYSPYDNIVAVQIHNSGDFFTIDDFEWADLGQPCCDVDMIPDDDPVIVPPGGNFGFTGFIANPTDQPIVTDVWGGVLFENNFYQQFNFSNISLNPGQSLSAHSSQHVPGFAPNGTYEYIAYCGDRPEVICDQAIFPFTVEGTRVDGGADEWYLEGGLFGVGDETDAETPLSYALMDAYPNPFNASTQISFTLPQSGNVRLDVYNLMGQKVSTLVDGVKEAGYHSVTWDASQYSSGVYFYKLSAGDKVFTKRMTLLK